MYDDAENLAGAGTDVQRCSNALGPRKNLHRLSMRLGHALPIPPLDSIRPCWRF
jgi:hypothetical protein